MDYIFQVIVLKFVKCLTNLIIIAWKTIYTASHLSDQFGFTTTPSGMHYQLPGHNTGD